MSVDRFMNTFASLCRHRDSETKNRPFALVLGAGASRSAGIPTASEMIGALELLANASGIRIARPPVEESKWSWVFRQVIAGLPGDRPFHDYAREFIAECVSRAHGEANTTHLLAAALTNGGVFRYIVTTNFDNQALAAFWSLPRGHKGVQYTEPHVIYDIASMSVSMSNIAPKVPVVLKAHGHHTTYGLGIVDKDIDALAPHVQRAMHELPAPAHGFLVVGYSGAWNDGIMRTLADKTFMSGKTVYWFYRGAKRPAGQFIRAIAQVADLSFVRVTDSDDLFLRLWWASESNVADESDDRNTMLTPAQLFAFSAAFRTWAPTGLVSKERWWHPSSEWPTKKLRELRRQLLPALLRSEADDENLLVYQCLPDGFKNRVAHGRLDNRGPQLPHLEWQTLFTIMPVGVPWTRRNRKLVLRALSKHCHLGVRYQIMQGLAEWGYHPRET